MSDVLDVLQQVDKGQYVLVETTAYAWKKPMQVKRSQPTEWAVPHGSNWETGVVELSGTGGASYEVRYDLTTDKPPQMHSPASTTTHRGSLKRFEVVDETADHDEESEGVTQQTTSPVELDWVARDAIEIVEESTTSRSLLEVVDAVESEASILQIHRRICSSTLNATKDLLWELGLVAPGKFELVEDDVLTERIEKFREVYS